jgi:hypothetical protein
MGLISELECPAARVLQKHNPPNGNSKHGIVEELVSESFHLAGTL